MLYSEFIENTGCKVSDYNYNVYKNLEELYTKNDKLTKEDIYKIGKKLVDNSKTKEQLEIEEKINSRIEIIKKDIEWMEQEIEKFQSYIEYWPNEDHKEWKEQISWRKKQIKKDKIEIKNLKWVLA